VRQIAWGISWITLLLLLVDVLRRLRRPQRGFYETLSFISVREARLLGIVFIGFLMSIMLFATPESPYLLHARPGYALDNSAALRTRTDVGLEALSYHLDKTDYRAGQSMNFFIAWRTSRIMLQNYSVQVFLRDTTQGIRWVQSEPRFPGGYPTRRWPTHRYVRDEYSISLPSDLRPGEYQIGVEVYQCSIECLPENRLNFFDPNGQLIGQTLLLPVIITVVS
jgi:hypothetical protein